MINKNFLIVTIQMNRNLLVIFWKGTYDVGEAENEGSNFSPFQSKE